MKQASMGDEVSFVGLRNRLREGMKPIGFFKSYSQISQHSSAAFLCKGTDADTQTINE